MLRLKSERSFVNVRLSSTWYREFQVLPQRTRPENNMSGTGGYLLSGIKISEAHTDTLVAETSEKSVERIADDPATTALKHQKASEDAVSDETPELKRRKPSEDPTTDETPDAKRHKASKDDLNVSDAIVDSTE